MNLLSSLLFLLIYSNTCEVWRTSWLIIFFPQLWFQSSIMKGFNTFTPTSPCVTNQYFSFPSYVEAGFRLSNLQCRSCHDTVMPWVCPLSIVLQHRFSTYFKRRRDSSRATRVLWWLSAISFFCRLAISQMLFDLIESEMRIINPKKRKILHFYVLHFYLFSSSIEEQFIST